VLGNDPSFCRCVTYVEDAYALAVNSLPPRYIQVTRVEKYTQSRDFINRATIQGKYHPGNGKDPRRAESLKRCFKN